MDGACLDTIPTGLAMSVLAVAWLIGMLTGALLTLTHDLRDRKAGGVSTSPAGSPRPSPKEG